MRAENQEGGTTSGKVCPRRPVEETNSRVTRFVQRVKHSMTLRVVINDHGASQYRISEKAEEQEAWGDGPTVE